MSIQPVRSQSQPPPGPPPLSTQVVQSLWTGVKALVVMMFPVNAGIKLSVYCIKNRVTALDSFRKVTHDSPARLLDGIHFYVLREIGRTVGKSLILGAAEPYFRRYHLAEHLYGKQIRIGVTSLALTLWEGFVHPLDSACTMIQNEVHTFRTVIHHKPRIDFYKGVRENMKRQLWQYLAFLTAQEHCIESMRKHTQINPYSFTGMFLNAFPVTVVVAGPNHFWYHSKVLLQSKITNPKQHMRDAPLPDTPLNKRIRGTFLGFIRSCATGLSWRLAFTYPAVCSVYYICWKGVARSTCEK